MAVDAVPRRVRVELGIYRRPDGSLEIGFRDAEGRQRWRKVQGGVKAARAALAEEHAKRARGERVAADPRLRFSDAADAWWDARVVRLRPMTQATYKAALAHLKRPEFFGRSRLVDITAADVARYVARQQAAGKKGWTIRGHLTVLGSVFTYASRHMGFVGVNPVSLLDRVERPSSADESEKRVLADDELRRLLACVAEAHRLLFELAAETGARLSEALGLVWENVDLEGETVTFTHQLDRAGERRPLKTKKSRRCLEVTPQLIVKLRAAKVASAHSGARDLVFTTARGTGHDQRNITRVLARAVKKAGLEAVENAEGVVVVPAPTFHSLRHTHASRLIAAGWDMVEISSRLGHSDVATTQRVYAHEFDAARRSEDRRQRLTALYGGAAVEASVEATGRGTEWQTVPMTGAEVVALPAAGGR